MAILIDAITRIVVQGATGHTGRALMERWVAAGSPVVGGVTPGRQGARVAGKKVVDSCFAAVAELAANASFIAVPAPHALEAALEAIAAGIGLIVVYTEGVPVHDALIMRAAARSSGTVLLGPNAAGCVSPGFGNLSDLNERFLTRGPVGVVSKSGTLTYEVISSLATVGYGVSSVVCLGGDVVIGTDHARILQAFEEDGATEAVVLIGEIGGDSEHRAAAVIGAMTKPVLAHIVGRHAPRNRAMGHAGALLASEREGAEAKSRALRGGGARLVRSVLDVGAAMTDVLANTARNQPRGE